VRRRLANLSEDLAARVAELEDSRHRLSVAAEEERRRLERDLHDGAQQEMLGLLSQLELARATNDPEVRQRALGQAADLGRSAYDTVRSIAHGVRPASLDDLGLTEALRGVVRRFPAPVELTTPDLPRGALPADAEAAVLFTASEGLANVLRHAQATRVRVAVVAEEGTVTLTVEYDGVGGAEPGGPGLRGIRDRVEAAGGRLTLSSTPGCTRLVAAFPAPPTQERS
jgi:signal transduction histidine kinase